MNALSRLFFESPGQLALLALGLLLIAYVVWLRSETRLRAWAFPIWIGSVGALFAAQALVRTTREDVLESLDHLIRAVEARNEAAVMASFAPDYQTGEMDRAALEDYLRDALRHVEIIDSRVNDADLLSQTADTAAMDLSATATVRMQGFTNRITGRWRIEWVRRPAGWQISDLRPIEVGGQPVCGLGQLRRW